MDDDDEAEQVLFQMQQKGYTVRTVIEQAAIGRLATARLTLDTDESILVDLLFSSPGIEKEIAPAAGRHRSRGPRAKRDRRGLGRVGRRQV